MATSLSVVFLHVEEIFFREGVLHSWHPHLLHILYRTFLNIRMLAVYNHVFSHIMLFIHNSYTIKSTSSHLLTSFLLNVMFYPWVVLSPHLLKSYWLSTLSDYYENWKVVIRSPYNLLSFKLGKCKFEGTILSLELISSNSLAFIQNLCVALME